LFTNRSTQRSQAGKTRCPPSVSTPPPPLLPTRSLRFMVIIIGHRSGHRNMRRALRRFPLPSRAQWHWPPWAVRACCSGGGGQSKRGANPPATVSNSAGGNLVAAGVFALSRTPKLNRRQRTQRTQRESDLKISPAAICVACVFSIHRSGFAFFVFSRGNFLFGTRGTRPSGLAWRSLCSLAATSVFRFFNHTPILGYAYPDFWGYSRQNLLS
jgi:hypothetical protein